MGIEKQIKEIKHYNLQQGREWSDKKENDLRLFLERWYSGGGFYRGLCETILKADANNTRRLYKAFPELVNGSCIYSYGKTFEECDAIWS